MIKLAEISTKAPEGLKAKEIKSETKELASKIGDLQHLMYAEGKKSLLVVLQGMDASGKDGTTKNAFYACNPIGIDSFGFKKPTELEFSHDFLWRCHALAPKKGNIMIFIRSHYEDILIQKVHNWIDDERRAKRMSSINSFEDLIQYDNNTTILKFYLHISPEEQLRKLQERIDDPKQHWKHNDGDWEERKYWDKYTEAYEYVINNSVIPWHIVPADDKWYRNYFVAQKVKETLESFDCKLPGLKVG
jgi:PPK2 family polyphosphate:nucleotide phosphotransferase